jgi:hypothetical protein
VPLSAVIGLAFLVSDATPRTDGVERLEGVNWLGNTPPQVSVMLWRHYESGQVSEEILPGLLIRSSAGGFVWLMLDKREGKCGRVYALGTTVFIICGEGSDAVDDREGDDEGGDNDEDDAEETHIVYSNWIELQRHVWKQPNDHDFMIGLDSV